MHRARRARREPTPCFLPRPPLQDGPAAAAAGAEGAADARQAHDWQPLDVLLAPAAPLVASLPEPAPGSAANAPLRGEYDPLGKVGQWAAPTGSAAGKYDPLGSALKGAATWQSAGAGALAKYDVLPALLAALSLVQLPRRGGEGDARWDPLVAARKARAEAPAAAAAHAGPPKYDMLHALMAQEAPPRRAAGGSGDWDPVAALLRRAAAPRE